VALNMIDIINVSLAEVASTARTLRADESRSKSVLVIS
jgi:hypothetical protein